MDIIRRNQLIKAVAEGIQSLPNTVGPNTRRVWTAEIKNTLIALGHREGYLTCPDNEGNIQWLYDLVWYTNNQQGALEEVPLVLESEWDKKPQSIRYDFEKLLLAKSFIKVMVFEDFGLGALPLLLDGIRAFNNKAGDELYLLAEFTAHDWRFNMHIVDGAANPATL